VILIGDIAKKADKVIGLFGLGMIIFAVRIFYGYYYMGYIVYIRLNHYGKVCSGDYIGKKNLDGYDDS
jgi:hypothetical protein